MMNVYYCIFSAMKSDETDAVNKMNHSTAHSELLNHGLRCDVVEGMYEGEHELSYLVQCRSVACLDKVLGIARQYKQESVLVCDADGNSYLFFVESALIQNLGKMNVYNADYFNKYVKDGCKAYTYHPATNKYYVV